jgi:hypothetical protein
MNLMLINVSTRKLRRAVRLPEGDLPVITGDGTSKSAASRRFVALSVERLAAWLFPGRDRTLPVVRQAREVLRFVCGVPTREIARRIGMAASLKSVVDFTDFDESDTGSEGNIARFEEAA